METEEGYNNIVEKVLRMAENDLFVKPEKYVEKVREVGFLGVVMGPDGVKMEKEKFQGVVNQPVPKGIKDVQKFLRLANYHRQFVKDLTRVVKPLHEMTRKDLKWNWRERQQRAFEKLKKRFTMELVLVIPDLDKEIRVEIDVSDFTTGGVLLIKQMLEIIRYSEVWRHFLEGAKGQFEIWINHKLEYFMKIQKLNQRQARQALYLSIFNFTLKHVAGKSVSRADSLSRRANQAERVERNNKNQVVLKKEWLDIRAIKKGQLLIEGAKDEIIEKIKKSEAKDDEVVKVMEEMKKAEVKVLRNYEWQIENQSVLKEEKMYLSKDESLRLEIIQLHHDTLIAGHREQ